MRTMNARVFIEKAESHNNSIEAQKPKYLNVSRKTIKGNVHLQSLNLSHLSLYGVDFVNALTTTRTDLKKARFCLCDLKGVSFFKTDFNGAIFTHCDFSKGSFDVCSFENVIFDNCDLTDSEFLKVDFKNCRFRNCKTAGAFFDGCKNILRLPVGDPRGYDCLATRHDHFWVISSGCRHYTLCNAKDHWGPFYRKDAESRAIGDRYLRAFEWLDKFKIPENWNAA